MKLGTHRLSEVIAEIWDRTHHIFPKSGKQKVLRWLMHTDTLPVTETEAFNEDAPAYPAKWATDSFDSNENIRWDGGAWGPD